MTADTDNVWAAIAKCRARALASKWTSRPVYSPRTPATANKPNRAQSGRCPAKPNRDKTTNAAPVRTLGTTTVATRLTQAGPGSGASPVTLQASESPEAGLVEPPEKIT